MSLSSQFPSPITLLAQSLNSTFLLNHTAAMDPAEWTERVRTTTLFAFFGSLGIVLNSLPILLTLCTAELRHNKVHVMVANLSTADLLFAVSFVFGQTQFILYREQLNPAGCRWLAFLTFTTAFFEFIFPPFLSVNRYISLYYNQYYERIYKARNIAGMVVGSWAFCTVIPLVFVLCGKTGFDDDNLHCCIVVKTSAIGWKVFYWLAIIVPLVLGANGTMTFCNYKIYKKLATHTGGAQSLKQNVVSQNRELLYFLIADMCFPVLFHTTYHLAKFISYDRQDLVQGRVFTTLYLINSCVRGLITLSMLRPYRRALAKLFNCLVSCGSKTGGVNTVGPAVGTSAGTPADVGGVGGQLAEERRLSEVN